MDKVANIKTEQTCMDGVIYWVATIDCNSMPCYTMHCNSKIPVRFSADTKEEALNLAKKHATKCHSEKVIIT